LNEAIFLSTIDQLTVFGLAHLPSCVEKTMFCRTLCALFDSRLYGRRSDDGGLWSKKMVDPGRVLNTAAKRSKMSPAIRNKTVAPQSTVPQSKEARAKSRKTLPTARLFAGLPAVSMPQLIDDRSRQLPDAEFKKLLSLTVDEPVVAILRALNDGRVLGLPAGGQHHIPARRGIAPYAAAYVGGGLDGLKLFVASIDASHVGLNMLQSLTAAMYRLVPMDQNIVFVMENPNLIRSFNYMVHVAQGGDTRLGTSDNLSVIFARLKLQPLLAAYAVDGLEGLKKAATIVAQNPAQRASPLEQLCAALDFPDPSSKWVADPEPPPTPLVSIDDLRPDQWQSPVPGMYPSPRQMAGASRMPSLSPPMASAAKSPSSNVSSLLEQQLQRPLSPYLAETEPQDVPSAVRPLQETNRSGTALQEPISQFGSQPPLVWPSLQADLGVRPASLELQLEINGRHVTASLDDFYWISAGQCPPGTEHYVESITINRLPYRGTRADLRFLLGAD
jgi:hypothetical protein